MKWKPFLYIQIAALFLFATWLWPVTHIYWESIDHSCFLYLNGSLDGHPLAQIFWAIANVRAVDLVGAIFMSSFLVLYILDGATPEEKRQRISKMIFMCIWFELGILFTKDVLDAIIQKYQLLRDSPTVLYSHSVMLSEAVPWLKVKDFSRSCFPGDHAEIVIQWLLFVFVLCGVRYGLLALPFALFFIMPRLIGGAHWLSDALVGSLSIATIVLAWALYSPLYYYTWLLATWIGNKIAQLFRIPR